MSVACSIAELAPHEFVMHMLLFDGMKTPFCMGFATVTQTFHAAHLAREAVQAARMHAPICNKCTSVCAVSNRFKMLAL